MNNVFTSAVVAFLTAQKRGIADVSDLHRKLDAVIDTMVFDGVLRRVGDGKTVELVTEKSVQTASLRKKKESSVIEDESLTHKKLIALTATEHRIFSFVRGAKDGEISLQVLREKSLEAGISSDVFNACLGALSGKDALLWSAATNSYKFNSKHAIQVVGERNARIHRQEGFWNVEESLDENAADVLPKVSSPPPSSVSRTPAPLLKFVRRPLSSKEIDKAVVQVFERNGGTVTFPSLVRDLVKENALIDDAPSSQVVVAKKLRDMRDEKSRPLFCLAVEDIGQWNRVVYSNDKPLPEVLANSAIPMNFAAEDELEKVKEKREPVKRERKKVEKSLEVPVVEKKEVSLDPLADKKVAQLVTFMLRRLIDVVPKRSFLYELENHGLIKIGDVAALDAALAPLLLYKMLVADEGAEKFAIQRDEVERFHKKMKAM